MAGGTVAMPLINEGISLPGRVMGLRRAGLDRIERVGRRAPHRGHDHPDPPGRAGRRPAAAPWPRAGRRAGPSATWARSAATCSPRRPAATSRRRCSRSTPAWSSRGRPGRGSLPLAELLDRLPDDRPRRRRAGHLDRRPGGRGPDGVRQVRAQGGQHAVRRHGRGARDDGRRHGDGRPDRARCRRAAPDAHDRARRPRSRARAWTRPRSTRPRRPPRPRTASPITDAVASDWYRRRMVGVFVRRALAELAAPAAGREA